jgi:hypothetical protein
VEIGCNSINQTDAISRRSRTPTKGRGAYHRAALRADPVAHSGNELQHRRHIATADDGTERRLILPVDTANAARGAVFEKSQPGETP